MRIRCLFVEIASMDGSDGEIDLPDTQLLEPKTEPVEEPEALVIF